MKTKKSAILILIALITAVFASCQIALGTMVNLDGPVVTLFLPVSRQPVTGVFYISGSATDKTGVDIVSIKAHYTNKNGELEELPVQWRYFRGWQVSADSGGTWNDILPTEMPDGTIITPNWDGTPQSANWEVPIDISKVNYPDGQYMFTVTAKSFSGLSDDNSIKTRIVIFYKNPHTINIVTPIIYDINSFVSSQPYIIQGSEFEDLYNLQDYRDSSYLGKFVNDKFNLQWQIEERSEDEGEDKGKDIWAIDIRFYEAQDEQGNYIDPLTGAQEENYIFKMYMNDIQNRPLIPSSDETLKPNGRIEIPDLNLSDSVSSGNTQDGAEWEIKKQLPACKTIIQVVTRCMNAAGLVEERIAGCFAYWPDSDKPWIQFPEDLKDDYGQSNHTAFPDSTIPVKAYDDDGVAKIVYSLYSVSGSGDNIIISQEPIDSDEFENPLKNKSFSWSVKTTSGIGYFYIIAVVTDTKNNTTQSAGFYQTRDISWPEIKPPYTPVSTQPLYKFIKEEVKTDVNDNRESAERWTINIKGIASDTKGVEQISMVWINPRSTNYAAMSQLAYFREPDYEGWTEAENSSDNPYLEGIFEKQNPDPDIAKFNKVWKFAKEQTAPSNPGSYKGPGFYPNPAHPDGINPNTKRSEVEYNVTLNLKDHLSILPNIVDYNWLKSQVFVFKVTGDSTTEDGKAKTNIIVWSPEGSSLAPFVDVTKITINRANNTTEIIEDFKNLDELNFFVNGDEIVIEGIWKEDSYTNSTQDLTVDNVIKPYFDIHIGAAEIPKANAQQSERKNTSFIINDDGTWSVTAEIGSADKGETHALRVSHLRDTLMINAKLTNIGGHISEYTKTWFVKSDKLDFMRLGSDTNTRENGIYNTDGIIDIFLEFNKPVILKTGRSNPVLTLNSGGTAAYVPNSTPDTRQLFRYKVGAGNTTGNSYLNITGKSDAIAFDAANYPLTWITAPESGAAEEIRMVPGAFSYEGEEFIPRALPLDGTTAFNSVRELRIDTAAPTLTSIVLSGRGGWYGSGNTIYITANFSEEVVIASSVTQLTLRIGNTHGPSIGTGQQTGNAQANGNSLIFAYPIRTEDFTNGDDVIITDFIGVIKDDAENLYSFQAPFTTAYPAAFRTPKDIEGHAAKVKAIPLSVPALEVHIDDPSKDTCAASHSFGINCTLARTQSGGVYTVGASSGSGHTPWNPGDFSDSEGFNDGYSGGIVKLNNYYSQGLWLLVKPSSYETDFDKLEYTTNYGRGWKIVTPNFGVSHPTWAKIPNTTQGHYDISVKQTDSAGNASPWSQPVTLYWDRGDLLTRVSSAKPGGTYTSKFDGTNYIGDQIPITLTFRRPVTFSTLPQLRLTADDGTAGQFLTVSPCASSCLHEVTCGGSTIYTTKPDASNPNVHTYTMTYTVGHTDTTRGGNLNVTNISGFTATDTGGANVTSMINLSLVNDENNPRNLADQRQIVIQTGRPNLIKTSGQDILYTQLTINPDDSVQGTIKFRFDANVTRGFGNIYIEPTASDYRLPGVLTETQYNSLRSVSPTVAGYLAAYYKEGTNGYTYQGGPDISKKYILDFNICTFDTASYNEDLKALAAAMMAAESITIRAMSSFVTITQISSNPVVNEVTVSLSGAGSTMNTLKIPGSTYTVKFDAGFVQDSLGNVNDAFPNAALSHVNTITASGISKPFIRIQKPVETISSRTSTNGLPSLYINQADRASQVRVRLDSRTAGSVVRYVNTTTSSNVTASNISTNDKGESQTYTATNADPGRTGTAVPSLTNGSIFGLASDAAGASTAPFTVGDALTGSTYTTAQSQKVRIYAISSKGTTLATTLNAGSYTEEMLYRTVLTFNANNINFAFQNGDQLWIRGGDTLTGATIPGFPLSMEDNYAQLQSTGRQAGIRLMTRIDNASTSLASSRWQWITWDMTVPAYITVYLGRDTTSSAAIAKQYGPLNASPQIENWSFVKSAYRLMPGEHRWLNSSTPDMTGGNGRVGSFSFNGAFTARPANLTATLDN